MRALQVDAADNVAVAVQDVPPGGRVAVREDLSVTALEEIPTGHKIALCDIPAGEMVIKYGVPIGQARRNIAKGSYVHTHNVADITTRLCQEYASQFKRRAAEMQ